MRAHAHVAFHHLDAAYVTSMAFTDNPASLAVSKKTCYTGNGVDRVARPGKPAIRRRIALEPENLVRYEHGLTVAGVRDFRRSIGLDSQLAEGAARSA
jgi:hypothetical protein